ncbi:MAG TPA: glutamyl-tRNA reductase [Syntrophomonas sp.]|nr:glutamyl-tRNA reductase [Syntrophomonas sp.]
MYVLLAGLSHRTAPVEIREKCAFGEKHLEAAYKQLTAGDEIEGLVILSTCNRTELYATTRDIPSGQKVLKDFLLDYSGLSEEQYRIYMYQPNCYDAIAHLFKVSSGLDSMILGETQILGQVKHAFQTAQDYGASDVVLNALFQKALYVGKKVRTDTRIDQHPVSVSYAAVDLAGRQLGCLQNKTVLVVGAGETGQLTTRYLIDNGIHSVIVSNRSFAKAQEMAAVFEGRAIRFDQITEAICNADIVISCTAANHCVITEENCGEGLRARQGRPIIIIDIAVPRDVETELQQIDGVTIYDIDDLQDFINVSYQERRAAATSAEDIIAAEMDEFNQWLATLYVVPVITALKRNGEMIKQAELKRAFNRLGKMSEHDQIIIQKMAGSIVNQLLRSPVLNLKEMAVSNQGHLYAEVANKLFDLDVDCEAEENNASYKIGDPGQ